MTPRSAGSFPDSLLAMADLGEKLRPVIEAHLEPGEELRGVCIGAESGMFKGRQVVVGTTDRRLIVQGMNRRFAADGDPVLLTPDRIADASAEGAGGGWLNVGPAILDATAVTLKLRTVDGQKLKINMMRGTGPLGGLGGGESQREGLEALAAWFRETAP
jgi:hypothetical protein